ncbi:MAG: Sec-independent protein translocase protein TatB [Candidatus Igneacidithiobacillus chanchocoensis]
MFDFSFGELALLAVIALIVVGPEKMPELARTVGKWVGYFRRTMNNVRSEVEQQLLLDEMRKEAEKLRGYAKEPLDAVEQLHSHLEEPLLPAEATLAADVKPAAEEAVSLPAGVSGPTPPQGQTLH